MRSGAAATHSSPSTTGTSSNDDAASSAMRGMVTTASSSVAVRRCPASRSLSWATREKAGNITRETVWPIIWTGMTSTR